MERNSVSLRVPYDLLGLSLTHTGRGVSQRSPPRRAFIILSVFCPCVRLSDCVTSLMRMLKCHRQTDRKWAVWCFQGLPKNNTIHECFSFYLLCSHRKCTSLKQIGLVSGSFQAHTRSDSQHCLPIQICFMGLFGTVTVHQYVASYFVLDLLPCGLRGSAWWGTPSVHEGWGRFIRHDGSGHTRLVHKHTLAQTRSHVFAF